MLGVGTHRSELRAGASSGDALDGGAEAAQALVDALVAAVDLADVADHGRALRGQPAISIAMPARMSGDSKRSP